MFRVVTPPIIRSTYNCNYSIWHRSNFGKCSVWSQLKMRGMDPGPYLSSLADLTPCIFRSLTSAKCCNYSYICSWWWVELPPETCRAVYRNIINCIQSNLVGQLLTQFKLLWFRSTDFCSSQDLKLVPAKGKSGSVITLNNWLLCSSFLRETDHGLKEFTIFLTFTYTTRKKSGV